MVEIKKIGLCGLMILIIASCSIKMPLSSHQDCGKIPVIVYGELMADAAILTGQFTEDVYNHVRSSFSLDTSLYFRSTFTTFKKDTCKLLFHYDSLQYNHQGSRIMIKPASYCKWESSLTFKSLEYEVQSKVQRMDLQDIMCFTGNYTKTREINKEGDSVTVFTLVKPIKLCN